MCRPRGKTFVVLQWHPGGVASNASERLRSYLSLPPLVKARRPPHEERKLSRCKLSFGNAAAVVKSRESTPRRPSLDLWKGGLSPSARDRATLEGAVVVRALPTARQTHATPASYRWFASLADCRPRKHRVVCDIGDLANPIRGLRRRRESMMRWEKRTQNKMKLSAVLNRMQGCFRTSP